MKEYMYLFRGGDAHVAAQSPEAMQQHMQKWVQWMKALGEKGKFVGGQPLDVSGVTLSGTKKSRTDRPFAESKEMVGGYLIVKAANLEEAVELSKECPIFESDGTLEVREIRQMPA
jgi:hypothetical protein